MEHNNLYKWRSDLVRIRSFWLNKSAGIVVLSRDFVIEERAKTGWSRGANCMSYCVPFIRVARTITVLLVGWFGFLGLHKTLVEPLRLFHPTCVYHWRWHIHNPGQNQRSGLFVPSPQTQGKAVGWNKRSGSTKRSREEHQSFQPVLLFTQPKSHSYCVPFLSQKPRLPGSLLLCQI